MPRTLAFAALALALVGCAPKLPALVPAEGVVTLNGKPLPNAFVTFTPMLDHFGAETNSTAITDENGKFVLAVPATGAAGAYACEHRVTVTEPPLPDELRRSQDGEAVDRYRSKAGNRPIPQAYAGVGSTPLTVTVTAGQGPIPLELTR